MNFDNFKYKKECKADINEYYLFLEEIKMKTIEELTNNAKYQKFYKKYDPNSIPAFIIGYAQAKRYLIEKYQIHVDIEEHNKELLYKQKALDRFNWIKQKKLWDIQLQWRAEKIKIDEIDMSCDFQFWGEHIEECPFMPLVTKEEVEILKEYLKLNNLDYLRDIKPFMWQNYDEIITNLPAFYTFYDINLKKNNLKDLQNIRGEKEHYYYNLKLEKDKQECKENIKANHSTFIPELDKEQLLFNPEKAIEYAELFEKDHHYKNMFILWKEDCDEIANRNQNWTFEEIETSIDLLKEAGISVKMPANADWRQAIVECAQQFINDRIIEELDNVFEHYIMLADLNVRTGRSMDQLNEDRKTHFIRELSEAMIFDGRELIGEPRDYNF